MDDNLYDTIILYICLYRNISHGSYTSQYERTLPDVIKKNLLRTTFSFRHPFSDCRLNNSFIIGHACFFFRYLLDF